MVFRTRGTKLWYRSKREEDSGEIGATCGVRRLTVLSELGSATGRSCMGDYGEVVAVCVN